jgi:hypothetical protein
MLLILGAGHRLKDYSQLGSKFGTWLLERQLTPKYGYMGTNKEGAYLTVVILFVPLMDL